MLKKRFLSMIKISVITIVFASNIIFNSYADDEINELNEAENVEEILKTAVDIEQTEDIPKLNSREAIIIDKKSKRIIYGKNENKRVAMASTTKIMTAIIVLENANLNDEVIVSAKAAGIGGSRLGLKKNDKITVMNLLYGLMLCSGNDAAIALAEHVAGSVESFADKMNEKAKDLKLQNTHFVTPHGLDNPEHYTTAYELAIIADYAMDNEEFTKIVGTKNATVMINGYSKNIKNTNELLGYLNGVKGIKTGFTNNAGRCLVTCTNRSGFEIITVVLGADTKKFRTEDSIKLIEYTYKNFKEIDITQTINSKFSEWKKMNENRMIIEKAKNNSYLQLEYEEIKNKCIPIKLADLDKIEVEINSLTFLNAPVECNTILGNMKIILKDEVIETVNIVNKQQVEKKNKIDYFLEFLDVIA